jgi:hypothetical protein
MTYSRNYRLRNWRTFSFVEVLRHKEKLSKTYFYILTYSTVVASMPFRNELFSLPDRLALAPTQPLSKKPDLFAGNKTAIARS